MGVWGCGCGSGADEIDIICTNTGPGQQVCAATGGANVDVPVANDVNVGPTPTR